MCRRRRNRTFSYRCIRARPSHLAIRLLILQETHKPDFVYLNIYLCGGFRSSGRHPTSTNSTLLRGRLPVSLSSCTVLPLWVSVLSETRLCCSNQRFTKLPVISFPFGRDYDYQFLVSGFNQSTLSPAVWTFLCITTALSCVSC